MLKLSGQLLGTTGVPQGGEGAPRKGGCPKVGRVPQGGEDTPRDAQLPVVAVLVESSVLA